MQTTITLENIDETTARWLNAEAVRRGTSEDKIVLDLIRKQIQTQQPPTFHDLDYLAGTWSEQDAAEFERATNDFNKTDEKLW